MTAQNPYTQFGVEGRTFQTASEKQGGRIFEVINQDTNSEIKKLLFNFDAMQYVAIDSCDQVIQSGKILAEVPKKWLSRDPLENDSPNWTPYNSMWNNPILYLDPDGAWAKPIYSSENGNFLGTDDEGLQGEAIIMSEKDFSQGMSPESALEKGTLRSELPMVYSPEVINRIDEHFTNLPNRPDFDGYLTLEEANNWYNTGNGQELFAELSQLDLSRLYSLGENYVGVEKTFNLLTSSPNLNDGLVYGSISTLIIK